MAEEPLVVNQPFLSTEVAIQAAQTAVHKCFHDQGIPVAATVLDRNGLILAQIRHTMAPPLPLK